MTKGAHFELLANSRFLRIWLVGACRGIAQWLEMLVGGVFAFELTGSPFMVALLVMSRLAPLTLLGSLVGAYADRLAPKPVLLCAFGFAACASFAVFISLVQGHASYWILMAASIASGIVWSSDMPVRRRLLGDVAGRERIVTAMGLDSATQHATRMLGPLTGGLIYQFLGPQGAYLVACLIALVAVGLIASLDARAPGGGGALPKLLTQWREGFAFALRNRDVIRFLQVTVVFNVWGFPFITMIPVIGKEQLALDAGWIGALAALEGGGALIGCLVLATRTRPLDQRRYYFFGTFFYIAFALVVGLMADAISMAGFIFIAGLSMAGFSTMQSALVFTIAPPEMRSRLFGLVVICIGSGLIGVANIGLMGEFLGGAGAVRVVAAEGLLAMLAIAATWPELWARRPDAGTASQTTRAL